ncbi:GP46-like surface antigen, putative [Bodo saltans]|uniref:GP46-like surface antigen, putative n=1 Tax=Bodo saltans TaxID=75058 RepID=A0A0S4KK75_BODSA|nr:GP46-like surface antigen, putative [Bodo saltans]|eukprot:CUI14733.1 GP46-like surface antigen, putative [Bodo saltans]
MSYHRRHHYYLLVSSITALLLVLLLVASTTGDDMCGCLSRVPLLLDFFYSTNGPQWTAKTNWGPLNATNCSALSPWFGVTCSNGDIIEVNLASNGLTGTLPSSFSALTSLTNLDFHGNSLVGSPPSSWSQLSVIQSIFLQDCKLNGTLPDEWGVLSNLRVIQVHVNRLVGTLPSSWGSLGNNMFNLYLSANSFQGTLPTSWGSLTGMQYLMVHTNQLNGTLPSEWGSMTNMKSFRADGNQLSGTLPASYATLAGDLYFSNNRLRGTIPAAWSSMTRVTSVDLSTNCLVGPMPVGKSGIITVCNTKVMGGRIPSGCSGANLWPSVCGSFYTKSDEPTPSTTLSATEDGRTASMTLSASSSFISSLSFSATMSISNAEKTSTESITSSMSATNSLSTTNSDTMLAASLSDSKTMNDTGSTTYNMSLTEEPPRSSSLTFSASLSNTSSPSKSHTISLTLTITTTRPLTKSRALSNTRQSPSLSASATTSSTPSATPSPTSTTSETKDVSVSNTMSVWNDTHTVTATTSPTRTRSVCSNVTGNTPWDAFMPFESVDNTTTASSVTLTDASGGTYMSAAFIIGKAGALRAGRVSLIFILVHELRIESVYFGRVLTQGTAASTVTALNRTAIEVALVPSGSQYLATAATIEIPLHVLAGVCVWGRHTVRVDIVLTATVVGAMQVTQSVALVAGPLSAVSATPASAVAVTRMNILLSLLECEPVNTNQANGNNMLSVLVGPQHGASTRGAVVGNMAIVAAFAGILGSVILVFAMFGRCMYRAPLSASLYEMQNVFHFPGILMMPIAAVCQPTMAACIQLIVLEPVKGDRLFGILGLSVMVLLLMGPFTVAISRQFCLVLVSRSEHENKTAENVTNKDNPQEIISGADPLQQNDGPDPPITEAASAATKRTTSSRSGVANAIAAGKHYAKILFEERATWQPIIATKSSIAWKKRFVPLYMDCGTWWYPLADMWMAASVGAVGGLTIGNSSVCYAQLAVVALSYGATATLQMFVVVPLVLSSKVYSVALQVLGFASCGALVVEFLAPGETPAVTVATWCLLAITVLSTVKSGLDVVMMAIAMPQRMVKATKVIKAIPPLPESSGSPTHPRQTALLNAADASTAKIVVDFDDIDDGKKSDDIGSIDLDAENDFVVLEMRAAAAAAEQQQNSFDFVDLGRANLLVPGGHAPAGEQSDDLARYYNGALTAHHNIVDTDVQLHSRKEVIKSREEEIAFEWDHLLGQFDNSAHEGVAGGCDTAAAAAAAGVPGNNNDDIVCVAHSPLLATTANNDSNKGTEFALNLEESFDDDPLRSIDNQPHRGMSFLTMRDDNDDEIPRDLLLGKHHSTITSTADAPQGFQLDVILGSEEDEDVDILSGS